MSTLPWRGAALPWFLLLVVGQAASLALIEAGPRVSYQHYQPPVGPLGWSAVAVLLLQGVVVARAIGSRVPAMASWLRAHLSPVWRWLIVAGVVLTSATASKDAVAWGIELVAATVVQGIALGNVWLLAAALQSRTGTAAEPWFRAGDGSPWRDPVAWRAALLVLCVGSLLAWVSYERHPHVPDEVAYLLQARYFAEGMLWMPAPPAPLAFNLDLMHYEATRWYTPTPPGWPAVLAVGVRAGVPWLVNPLLGALNVILAHRVLASMYSRGTARLATVLLATSPWFVFMSMNFMTHQATLCCALLAAVAVARLREDRVRDGQVRASSVVTALCGGLAIGAASLIRPLEGLAIALLLGFWSLPARWWTTLWRVGTVLPSGALALGAVIGGLLVRPYNRLMTGDASYFPIMAYIDKYYTPGSNDLGFGANRGLGWSGLDPFPGHGVLDVIVNAALNAAAVNTEWLGWATGSVLLLLLVVGLGRLSRPDWWHLAVFAMIIGVHSFYWFSGGPDFGARYWFLIVMSCAALSARGLEAIDARLSAGSSRATVAGLALVAATWVTFVPWRAVDKYQHYRGMRPDIRRIAAERAFGRSLVFVRGTRHPDYASAAAYNPLDLATGETLYAWDATPEARAQALAAYPDRPVYFVDGPTVTRNGFQVAAGPLDHAQALAFSRTAR